MSLVVKSRFVRISGKKLAKLRGRLALSQVELGNAVGMTGVRVGQLENAESSGVYPKTLRGLAKLANKNPDDVAVELAPDPPLLDMNVEPYSEVQIPEIPLFDLPIAAGKMTELPEAEFAHDPRLLKATRFRVRIRGRSMEKMYKDGSIVEFVCLQFRPDGSADKLLVGADYYVQEAEMATFKRLKEVSDGSLVFAAINRREFPEDIIVHRGENGLRMARAVGLFLPV